MAFVLVRFHLHDFIGTFFLRNLTAMFGEVVGQEGLQVSDLLLSKVQFHQGDMLLDILELVIYYSRTREFFKIQRVYLRKHLPGRDLQLTGHAQGRILLLPLSTQLVFQIENLGKDEFNQFLDSGAT